jgi:hypothetical protein
MLIEDWKKTRRKEGRLPLSPAVLEHDWKDCQGDGCWPASCLPLIPTVLSRWWNMWLPAWLLRKRWVVTDQCDSWGRKGWVASVTGEEGRGTVVGWWESDSGESGWEAEEGGVKFGGKKKKKNPEKVTVVDVEKMTCVSYVYNPKPTC